jgi:hypothetical protein
MSVIDPGSKVKHRAERRLGAATGLLEPFFPDFARA